MSIVRIENIKPAIGGVVHVARKDLLDPRVVAAAREALEDRGVLVFPELHLDDAEQLAFTDAFGTRTNFTRKVPGAGEVYAVTLDKEINPQPEYVLGTFFWHIDGATIDQPLPKATLLSARKLSPTGGQTEFASTYAAYEALPPEEKAALDGVKVVHKFESALRILYDETPPEDLARWRGMTDPMIHPLVWTHNSGRKSLVIGTHADHVVGRPIPHGRSLLTRLQEWAAQPAFSYRHEWRLGDFVIWDNCGCMHRVVPYDETSGRRMHRTSIMGEERVVA
ncbi:MAG: TauD/TfdA family dioxygenase [Parvularculaceae bacterium]|nr:TauD/TfdA family dioxygenase [Parvularculaceae bacterium]